MSASPKNKPAGVPREWSDVTRASVDNWLAKQQEVTEKAIRVLREGWRTSRADWVYKNLLYYEHARSAIKWLRSSLRPKKPRRVRVRKHARPEPDRSSERGV